MFRGHDLPLPPDQLLFDLLRDREGKVGVCGGWGGAIMTHGKTACHLYAEFATSCIGGGKSGIKGRPGDIAL